MSFEEKRAWIQALVPVATYVVYLAIILGRARETPITEVSYVATLLVVNFGGVSALVMAMAEVDHFWIANVLYLAFILSATVGNAAKIVAYHRGFRPW